MNPGDTGTLPCRHPRTPFPPHSKTSPAMSGSKGKLTGVAATTGTAWSNQLAMKPSNTTQPRNSSHGMTWVTHSGVPCLHAQPILPPDPILDPVFSGKVSPCSPRKQTHTKPRRFSNHLLPRRLRGSRTRDYARPSLAIPTSTPLSWSRGFLRLKLWWERVPWPLPSRSRLQRTPPQRHPARPESSICCRF